jgi:hypothetical protein
MAGRGCAPALRWEVAWFRLYIALEIADNKVGGFSVANVICRPELHGTPTREQYDQFHAGMKELGLERTITRDGKVFHLPTGEYLGLNLSTPLALLALKINALAIQISCHQCKLTLSPVSDPAGIYIYGLEEDVSYASALASLFGTQPAYPGFSALAALVSSKHAPPQPTGILDFLNGMKS